MEVEKVLLALRTTIKNIMVLGKNKSLFGMLGNPTILYGSEIWGGSIYKETWKKIKQIHMHFIINNIKIKINTPYPNPLYGISCMESKAMIRYPVHTHEITNVKNKRLPSNA